MASSVPIIFDTDLFAVRPEAPFWRLKTQGHNHLFANGTNQWRDEPDRDHGLIEFDSTAREQVQQTIEALMAAPAVKAFPGAEGFGAWAQGGRGGRVFAVTHLGDSGPGSLREAVEARGPRTVVFQTSGTIALESTLTIRHPRLTIAGQTAPGYGICLRDAPLVIAADDVVVRFLRCRLGDQGKGGDAISIVQGRRIIVDHCSASWSLDEVLSSSTSEPNLTELTVQWCFITEALNPENHGFGSLIRGCRGARYTYHHNLYAHNRNRNPRPGNYDEPNPWNQDPLGLLLDFRNNVIYNWAGSYAGYNDDEKSVTRLNYVDNYLLPGPNSSRKSVAYREGSPHNLGYFAGNVLDGEIPESPWKLVNFSQWDDDQVAAYQQEAPFNVAPVSTEAAAVAYSSVLKNGSACLPRRDAVDRRIVREVQTRTGRIIDSPTEVDGWPRLIAKTPPSDQDGDGMPDGWEEAHGMDPHNADEGHQDQDGDGYTNMEEYLNGLVDVRAE